METNDTWGIMYQLYNLHVYNHRNNPEGSSIFSFIIDQKVVPQESEEGFSSIVPVCHLDLFEHGRSHVGLPASRDGLSHKHLVVGADLLYMYVEF